MFGACVERACIVITALLALTNVVVFVQCDVIRAIVDLEKLLHTEHLIANDIRSYIEQEQDRLQQLQIIADNYETHSKDALSYGADNYLANPVNAFLLVKRFTTDWYKVDDLLRQNVASEFLSNVTQSRKLPEYDDFTGAAQALLRLQDTYDLPTETLAKGEIQGAPDSDQLSADDCFHLGKVAYDDGDHYHSILWMTQALDMMKLQGVDPQHPELANIYDYLAYSAFVQGNIEIALTLTQAWLTLEPEHERALNNEKHYLKMLNPRQSRQHNGDNNEIPSPKAFDFRNERDSSTFRENKEYEALCRGENILPNVDAHQLYCEYSKPHGLHYFQLRPLKLEVAYHDPRILLFHDVMTDSEIETIKEIAIPHLSSSIVFNPQTGELETANYRISKSAWFNDDADPVVARITQRVAAITGLTMDTVEPLQVVNYGIGGHYSVHYDMSTKEEVNKWHPSKGNRIATALFYLSDVIAGGSTVFPDLGVTVHPEKGAMSFWHNLHRNGDCDMRTRHAACPVLAGRKWVANKWIHERGQEFTHYNCDDNPPEEDEDYWNDMR